jgi:hypothetical protein
MTEASFKGRAGEIWGYFIITMLLGFIPQFYIWFINPAAPLIVTVGLSISPMPISTAICLKLVHWFFSKIKLNNGTTLNFIGSYGPFLGWALLTFLSIHTIT